MTSRRTIVTGLTAFAAVSMSAQNGVGQRHPGPAAAEPLEGPAGSPTLAGRRPAIVIEGWPARLIAAASAQIGETIIYDPAYVRLGYPGGDVPRDRGVCTDVIIRAYRDAFGVDLQRLVHEDMQATFASYPSRWGRTKPDANIDHRRVLNLQVFWRRQKAELALPAHPRDFQPGDIATQTIAGKLPHVVIVSDRLSEDGTRPLVLHNIGTGTRLEDRLMEFPITGRYRWSPPDSRPAQRD